MKILVLGSGIIGVTTAYFLGAHGHEVEVIDRQPASAMETSFANGGQLSYSHAEPWANPGTLPKVAKWMFKKDAPLVLRPRADLDMITWGLKFLANCSASRAHANSVTLLRLGLYSKKKMDQLRTLTGIQFDFRADGILHVFSHEKEYAAAVRQSEFQSKFGCREDILSTAQCLNMEPALEHAARPIVGGIHAPIDESGDIHTFTKSLAALCEKEFGTVFHYNTTVEKLLCEKKKITGVTTNKGAFTADAYVMALGSYSPVLLRQAGIRVPIYPMKGYSITLPASVYSPKVSITDTELKIVYSHLGNRLRVAGTAEFAGYNDKIVDYRVNAIKRGVQALFPKAYSEEGLTDWACLRPQTPDGPPIIGKTPVENLYINTGHGTLGWTQAAGSAALLADVMDQKQPDISLNGLALDRYL